MADLIAGQAVQEGLGPRVLHTLSEQETDAEHCASGEDCKGKQAEADCADGDCGEAQAEMAPSVAQHIMASSILGAYDIPSATPGSRSTR